MSQWVKKFTAKSDGWSSALVEVDDWKTVFQLRKPWAYSKTWPWVRDHPFKNPISSLGIKRSNYCIRTQQQRLKKRHLQNNVVPLGSVSALKTFSYIYLT